MALSRLVVNFDSTLLYDIVSRVRVFKLCSVRAIWFLSFIISLFDDHVRIHIDYVQACWWLFISFIYLLVHLFILVAFDLI